MNLFKKVASTSFWTLVSRILGFIRDAVLAHQFGASFLMDAFIIAFKIPNMLRRIFAEGALTQAFVPIFANFQKNNTECQTRQFLASISLILIFILTIVVIFGILFSSYVVLFFAPGFSDNIQLLPLSSSLLKIMFVYILLISLTSLSSSVLQFFGNFIIPAISPILLNLSLILFALFFQNIVFLAIAVVVGGFLQLSLQLPFLKKYNLLVLPRIYLEQKKDILKMFRNMSGAILGVSVGYISILLNSIFASFLDIGSISHLYYADRLMELPTGIFGASLAVVLIPSLSKTQEDLKKYKAILVWGLKLCFLLSFPTICFFFVFSELIIKTLFEYGSFLVEDTIKTSYILQAYCLGIVSLVSIKVLATAFYAKFDIKTPVVSATISVFITQICNIIFLFYFHLGVESLALSVSIGSICNSLFLLFFLIRKDYFTLSRKGLIFLCSVVIASLLSIFAVLFIKNFFIFEFDTFLQKITILLIVGIVFLKFYFLLLWFLRVDLINLVKLKFI